MTRQEAAKLLNCSFAELAEKLGITTAAIAQWGDDKEIPLFT
jgi:transcriptional regulator with XRE-family HTH domain